jgi:hypothetical protein
VWSVKVKTASWLERLKAEKGADALKEEFGTALVEKYFEEAV